MNKKTLALYNKIIDAINKDIDIIDVAKKSFEVCDNCKIITINIPINDCCKEMWDTMRNATRKSYENLWQFVTFTLNNQDKARKLALEGQVLGFYELDKKNVDTVH